VQSDLQAREEHNTSIYAYRSSSAVSSANPALPEAATGAD